VVGSVSWLNGHTSGKLFLDWQGYARVLFPLATFFLWLLLVWSLKNLWHLELNTSRPVRAAMLAGLVMLLLVPATLFWAADPRIYPPVNPDTGGPTGASLLESTLGIIAILLILPYGCRRERRPAKVYIRAAWGVFGAEIILSLLLGRENASHHRPAQFLGLGSLLPWMVLMPAYYDSFLWPRHARRWLHAFLGWWSVLLASAWLIFLPGLLDRFKFTDGLVGHSHMAMAGFVASLNIFLLVVLLGDKQRIFDSKWAFIVWQSGVAGYVAVMFLAGWLESQNPAFNIVPGASRNLIYFLRLMCGGLMTASAGWWFFCLTRQKLNAKAGGNSK
jgi:cytochrome c oxidase cbb3-type subunit 1